MKHNFPSKKVFAVASGGGHWVQLLRLRPAFAHQDVVFVSTNAAYGKDVDGMLLTVTDANMNEKLKLLVMFFEMFFHLVRIRPDVVITTGAAPGFAAIVLARLLGARTIWVDSIANSEELSSSGRQAGRFAHTWLTQWEHLAKPTGPQFWGAVL
jgi:UDP-N-acetylglucosamine:LPS N-acetylglucosamine transferase